MKNTRKIKWTFANLFSETPSEVVAFQTKLKALLASGTVITWAETNATYGIVFALSAGLVDFILTGISFEEQ